MEGGPIYYFPPIREFKDTGFVTHGFQNGATVSARVVRSNDSGGFAIRLIVKNEDGKEACDVVMDRFAALCLTDCLIKNLLNQEELVDNEYTNNNQLISGSGFDSKGDGMGGGKGAK